MIRAWGCLLAWTLVSCSTVDEGAGRLALEAALASAGTVEEAGAEVFLPGVGLPPHRATMRMEYRLEGSQGSSEIVIERIIDRGANQQFHIRDMRSWRDDAVSDALVTEGREAIFDGTRLATRKQGAPWVQREVFEDEQLVWLRAGYDLAPTVLGALGAYASTKEGASPRP